MLVAGAIAVDTVAARAAEDQATAAKAAAEIENAKAADVPPATQQPPADEPEKPAADLPAEEANEGRLIRVRLPLTGDADTRINSTIQRVVDQLIRLPRRDDRRPTLVLELSPQRGNTGFGEGTEFHAGAVGRGLSDAARDDGRQNGGVYSAND